MNSDHNILVLDICYPWDVRIRKKKIEIFNLRNKKCQAEFLNHTNQTDVLSRSLENRDVVTGGKHWLKSMKTLVHKNFRKIRITNNASQSKIQELLSKRNPEENDEEITEEICQRNRRLILEQIGNMSDMTGNMSMMKMWKVKQKVCPKNATSVPVAKLDEDGNLVCNRTVTTAVCQGLQRQIEAQNSQARV